jgi:hypothetical protein
MTYVSSEMKVYGDLYDLQPLKEYLNSLASLSVSEILDLLIKEEIKGERSSPCNCPIALLVKKKFPDFNNRYPIQGSIGIGLKFLALDGAPAIQLPASVIGAIYRIDSDVIYDDAESTKVLQVIS